MHRASALLMVGIVGFSTTAFGQQAKVGSNWQNVKALEVATMVDVVATPKHLRCKLSGVNSDSLSCVRGGGGAGPVVFQRTEIASIKIRHRVRSSLIAAGIGGGAGAIAGFALGTGGGGSWFGPNEFRGAITGVVAVMGAVIGGGVGALTNFSRSTVYHAP